MDVLGEKLRKLFGEDIYGLPDGKLTSRINERIDALPREKVQILSRSIEPGIKKLDSKIMGEKIRCRIYAGAAALGTAVAVGFGVYELAPVFEPLKEALSLFEVALESVKQETLKDVPDLIRDYQSKSASQETEYLARKAQGVLATLATFGIADSIAYLCLLPIRAGTCVQRLAVYRKIKERADSVLESRYGEDLDRL